MIFKPPAAAMAALPSQPPQVPWPTDVWPEGTPGAHVDQNRLTQLMSDAFSAETAVLGETHALLIVQQGRIVVEHYGRGHTADNAMPSWSKAKSITQALIGILVRNGRLDIHTPAPVSEWQTPGDPRQEITTDQLLRMSSGLAFREEYDPSHPSDVIEMLFGEGQSDMAGFAARFALAHPPGSCWSYSSGTSNIVARIAGQAVGGGAAEFKTFMQRELFEPLGMKSPVPEFDAAGTFIGSSFCNATARDFARFGLLYLRDGVWENARILPEGWLDYSRTATPQPPDPEASLGYGAHWWLGLAGPHSFSANGYEGQYTVIVPDLDLVLVRHGKSEPQKDAVQAWIGNVVDCFRGQ